MIICVDARPLVKKKVGFGFFLQNMLDAILTLDQKNEYILLSDREIFFDTTKYSNIKKVYYKDTLLFPKTFYYYFKMHKFLNREGIVPDVFWATNHIMPKSLPLRAKRVLTIHDFTHIKFPKSTTRYNLIISKLFFGPSIKNASHVICISKNTGTELGRYYQKEVKNKYTRVIYEGGYKDEVMDLHYNPENISDKIKEYSNDKYVLFVGTIEPRKNIQLLISAAPKLEGVCKILVCGKIGWEDNATITKLKNTDNLVYLDYITNDEKLFLMKHAFCQVQPSLYEGFGLPVVESMQAGTVVVVADNSSLSELVEKNELKFKTQDSNDFCAKICELQNKEVYEEVKQYCKKRGEYFCWKKAADEYLSIFTSKNQY